MEALLELLTGSPWTYALLFGIAAGDAVVPAFPSETALIVAGVLAAAADLTIAWVIAVGALGAFAGDSFSYALGRFVRACRFQRVRRRLRWARAQLDRRGGTIVLVARFIPGGRTATTFAAGTTRFPWLRRFAPFTAVAAIVWASYAALLGYFGGTVFEDSAWLALVLAFGIALVVLALGEGARRLRGA